MPKYTELGNADIAAVGQELKKEYVLAVQKNLQLDMSRGKPNSDQLDLANDMMQTSDYYASNGLDCRNYGLLDGIPEAKELLSKLIDVEPQEVIVGGNSSLAMMYDVVARAYTHGVLGSEKPWCKVDHVKFLCPSPGYDRHFMITEHFGFELITIPMYDNGPDMDLIEKLVSQDDSIKGIWCVPKYSNPQGITYSDEVVRRFANLSPKAKDFRIFWDNAYAVHDLYTPKKLLNILEECKKIGKENMVLIFGSTSKISFSGAGIGVMASSVASIEHTKAKLAFQTIGYDKLNQIKHVKFFKDFDGILSHMQKHAAILRPKFEMVLNILEDNLVGIGDWIKPQGGYFISFNTLPHCAKRTVELCKKLGVVMTNAGATFPYGKDPNDSNIRIAPTFPSLDELKSAMEIFCLCVKIATIEKLGGERIV